MEVISIASGSKGNCMLVMVKNHNLLIDVGLSMKKINQLLIASSGVDLEDINYVLISHSHSDHILSFKAIYNKYPNIKFILHNSVLLEIEERLKKQFDRERLILVDGELRGKKLSIELFELKHDTPCYGFSITDYEESLLFISDNGEYSKRFSEEIVFTKPYTYYVIESNYDTYSQYLDKTRNEKLKRRVLSTKGHSDNFNAIDKLIRMMDSSQNKECKSVLFHHLSEHCNSEELAKSSHNAYIEVWGHKTLLKGVNILYAKQNEIVRL